VKVQTGKDGIRDVAFDIFHLVLIQVANGIALDKPHAGVNLFALCFIEFFVGGH
jgi:hypothetical protein